MKVRSLLLATLSAALLLMCVLFFAAWSVGHQLDRQANIQSRAVEIGNQVSTLLVLTNEYALHAEARVVAQWGATQQKIVTGLEASQQSEDPAPAEALEQAQVLSQSFKQLIAPQANPATALEVRRTRFLINQLLTQTQAFFDTVERWGDAASINRLQLENRFRFLFYARTTAMMLILVMLVALLWHRVLRPLSALHTTVHALTEGNLDARCTLRTADEFGDLSRSFDTLADARQKSDAALREAKNFMTLLIDEVPGMVGYWTCDLVCTFTNSQYEKWFGKTKAEMIGIRLQDLLGEALFRTNEPFILAALRGERQQFEHSIVKPDGTIGYSWTHYVPDRDGDRVKGFFVLVSDITQIKLAEQAVIASEQFAISTFNSVNEQLCVLNSSGEILKVNSQWHNFYDKNSSAGTSQFYGVGTNYLDLCDLATGPYSDEGKLMAEGIRKVIKGDCSVFSLEYPCHRPDQERWFIASVTRFDGGSGNVVVAHQDISARKKAELELITLAQIDALTGLANRRHFFALAEQELARTRRYGGKLTVLMMDLDHFKDINDNHGHKAGDAVLARIGEVCRAVLRNVDITGRIGGEEFAMVLPETVGPAAIEVAERLREVISLSDIALENGTSLKVTASIGLVELAQDDDQINLLLNQADAALYEAKRTGRNKICVGTN